MKRIPTDTFRLLDSIVSIFKTRLYIHLVAPIAFVRIDDELFFVVKIIEGQHEDITMDSFLASPEKYVIFSFKTLALLYNKFPVIQDYYVSIYRQELYTSDDLDIQEVVLVDIISFITCMSSEFTAVSTLSTIGLNPSMKEYIDEMFFASKSNSLINIVNDSEKIYDVMSYVLKNKGIAESQEKQENNNIRTDFGNINLN